MNDGAAAGGNALSGEILPPDPDEGLAAGYWRENGAIWTNVGTQRRPRPLRLCSDMRAVHAESSPDGARWAVTVELVDLRGMRKSVCLSRAAAETDFASCMRILVDEGLVVHTDHAKRHRLILNAVVRAVVPLAYGVVKTGLTTIDGCHVFALPTGVITPSGKGPRSSVIVWRGDAQYGRVRQGGSRDGWTLEVVTPARMVPFAMTSIGVMLSGPAMPFLPKGCEKNTVAHLVGDSGCGKSTMVCVGASVHGKGSQPPDPDSFLESYKNTVNQVENVLLAHNHMGICFDEVKTIDVKAAQTFAYDFAMGLRKGRMNADGSSRPRDSWELPALSSGEITLADRANEHVARQQTMDAGADVRVLNIVAEGAFDKVGNFAERKAFVEALGAAAATHYGFAGPEFIRLLLDHEDDARKAIEKNLLIWKTVTAPLLGVAPSAQASRVASRLGSLVAPAALAAEVLRLPWGDDLSSFGVSATPAASAMFMAFNRVLDTWIGSHGIVYSTQTASIFQRLRAFYHSAPSGAFIICAAKAADTVVTVALEADIPKSDSKETEVDTVARRGWKAMKGAIVGEDRFGRTKVISGELVYVDFIPAVLEQAMGQSGRALTTALTSLRDQGLLIPESHKALRTQRKVDGQNTTVIRIMAEFFADG